MPAGGTTVSDLYAATATPAGFPVPPPVSGTDTATVEVIDITTPATLLLCTVSAGMNHCEDLGSSSASAGDQIEVKVTDTGGSAIQWWQVSFLY